MNTKNTKPEIVKAAIAIIKKCGDVENNFGNLFYAIRNGKYIASVEMRSNRVGWVSITGEYSAEWDENYGMTCDGMLEFERFVADKGGIED